MSKIFSPSKIVAVAVVVIVLFAAIGAAWYFYAASSRLDGVGRETANKNSGNGSNNKQPGNDAAGDSAGPAIEELNFVAGVTEDRLEQAIREALENGRTIADLETIHHDGKTVFSAIFIASDNPTKAQWGLSRDQFEKQCQNFEQEGFALIDIEFYQPDPDAADPQWAGVWAKDTSTKIQRKIEMTAEEWDELQKNELIRVLDLEVRSTDEGIRLTALYDEREQDSTHVEFVANRTTEVPVGTSAKLGMNNVDFSKDYLSHRGRKEFPLRVQPYSISNNGRPDVHFAVIYHDVRTDIQMVSQGVLLDPIEFEETHRTYQKKGYRLIDIHLAHYDGNLVYGGIWYLMR